MNRVPRALRLPAYVIGGWIALFALVNTAIVVAGVAARWAGKEPRVPGEGWPAITHLRMIEDKLVTGAQPTPADYRTLADKGVTTVIDVREGHPTEVPREGRDDPEALADLGIDYVSLPMTDGEAPKPEEIRRFVEAVEDAEGLVFAHCSGGVGRSTSLAAAFEASRGVDPSVFEQLAVGPPTVEQIWFVGTLSPGHPEHDVNPVVATASRVIDAPRNLWGTVAGWI